MRSPRILRGYHHSKRTILNCIDYIEDSLSEKSGVHSLRISHAVRKCSHQFNVPKTNIYRWWSYYIKWGEIELVIKEKLSKMKKKYRWHGQLDEVAVEEIRKIIEENPEYYSDEMAQEFARITGRFLSISTISHILKFHLGCSLQVCYDKAMQRDELERSIYQETLADLMIFK